MLRKRRPCVWRKYKSRRHKECVDSGEFSQVNDCRKNTMWNCGCWNKMKASADFWVEYIKKLTESMSEHQRRKGKSLWRNRQMADIWWMCYCWTDKSVSIENKCWVTVVSPGNSQDRCTFSPEQPGICTKVSVSTLRSEKFLCEISVWGLPWTRLVFLVTKQIFLCNKRIKLHMNWSHDVVRHEE